MINSVTDKEKAPSGRELTAKAAEGLFYRKSNLYNPSVTLTRATSLPEEGFFIFRAASKEDSECKTSPVLLSVGNVF